MGLEKRLTPEEAESARYQEELEILKGVLAERELELETLQNELSFFSRRHLFVVGRRYARLDRINALIAHAQALLEPTEEKASRAKEAESQARASTASANSADAEAPEKFRPSGDLKDLYRNAIKLLHPDLGRENSERAERGEVMRRFNAAYARGDEAAMRALLDDWQASRPLPEESQGDRLVRIIRQLYRLRERLEEIKLTLARLCKSDRYALMREADEVAVEGRDLLTELAMRVDEKIEVAKAELMEFL